LTIEKAAQPRDLETVSELWREAAVGLSSFPLAKSIRS
jgi:hypothetical protein